MSLSLGGASSPLSYKENISRALLVSVTSSELQLLAKGSFHLSQMLSLSSAETSFS